MFPKSLLFAFVASSLFLANVGVEASFKPNRLDTFDSYLPPAAANLEKRSPLEKSDVKGDNAQKLITDKTVSGADAYDNYQGAPKSITITSVLATTPADNGFLGICSLPFSSYDGIFSQDVNPRGSSVQAFMAEAQKTAKCTWLSPTDVSCVEQGGKADMKVDDMIWWKHAFCKRCSDAGGKNRYEFTCPDDSNGAKTMQGQKEVQKEGEKKGSKAGSKD
ncbi:related to Mig2 protein [Ustilago bromivora]|uniref:Related to Mig2 protein n=1 Tax=Ustilago bromivora TaxID=307758 RepID=A0A1K0G6M6_9BASI|nr:related to Mig2 protein [Ustilago bromivora]